MQQQQPQKNALTHTQNERKNGSYESDERFVAFDHFFACFTPNGARHAITRSSDQPGLCGSVSFIYFFIILPLVLFHILPTVHEVDENRNNKKLSCTTNVGRVALEER